MLVHLHRLRERGVPIPKHNFAFKRPTPGELTIREERDPVLNRHTRVAKLGNPEGLALTGVPPLLDVQLVELTRERMILSGIERVEDITVRRVEDFAQTWVCWLRAD